MSIPIYLARYPSSSLFNDHWALFVPDHPSLPPTSGTLLQVDGDPLNGFVHDIVRNCDISVQDSGCRCRPVLLELGIASVQHLAAVGCMQNVEPRSRIERLVLSVQPPGKSMRSAADSETARTRVDVRDCQWWVKEVVEKLVGEGVLMPEALRILEEVPAH
jgi:hypothetical protein